MKPIYGPGSAPATHRLRAMWSIWRHRPVIMNCRLRAVELYGDNRFLTMSCNEVAGFEGLISKETMVTILSGIEAP